MENKLILFLFNFPLEFNIIEWLASIISTFVIIYLFRAKINVGKIKLIKNENEILKFKIPVYNNSYLFSSTNIIIEASILIGEETFHFQLDRNNFIMLPKKSFKNKRQNKRIFQTINFENSTLDLLKLNGHTYLSIINNLNNDDKLRIRIHANHSFTNFGKAFEFNYKLENNNFIKE